MEAIVSSGFSVLAQFTLASPYFGLVMPDVINYHGASSLELPTYAKIKACFAEIHRRHVHYRSQRGGPRRYLWIWDG
jgi:hypothetical protein